MVDMVAHGLISFLAFWKLKEKKYIWLAVLFGLLPDILSWCVYRSYLFLTGAKVTGVPDASLMPVWALNLYGISHSLIVFAIVAIIILLCSKKFPIYILAWPLHILIDIVTHSRDVMPTPFLWPISDWQFPGLFWLNPTVFSIYWGLIILGLIYVYLQHRKNKPISKSANSLIRNTD